MIWNMAKKIIKTKSLYDNLISKYKPEQSLLNRKNISVRENSSVYKLELSRVAPSVVFCVDGIVITTGLRCDKLVLINSVVSLNQWDLIYLELKGTDISHAIRQLRATIKNTIFQNPFNRNRYARIVGSSFPSNKSTPDMEKAKIEFKKKYSCELKALKSNKPDYIAI